MKTDRHLLHLILIFIFSRIGYMLVGVRFDYQPLWYFRQFIDPVLLREDLFASLLYFHAQPPLFNLFLGFWLQVAGDFAHLFFWASFAALSLAMYIAMYRLMCGNDLSSRTSLAVVAAYMISPTAIIYENWLFYTWPAAALLTLSALALRNFLSRETAGTAALFFSLIGILALTRSAFHLVWVVAAIAALVLARPKIWRRTLAGAIVPFVLVVGIYAKNQVLFSNFSASSWLWWHFAMTTVAEVPEDERLALIESGALSPAAKLPDMAPPHLFAEVIEPPPPFGMAILDDYYKTNGESNYNHRIYLTVAEMLKRDDLYSMWNYPGQYARKVALAIGEFSMPGTDNHFIVANLEKIATLDAVYNVAVYGRFLGPVMSWFDVKPDSELYARTAKLGVFVLLIVGLVIGSGVIILVKGLRRRAVTDKEVVYLYIAMTLIYIAVISCLLVSFENNRNRVMIEPLLVVYAASWIKDYIDKRSSRLRDAA